MDQLIMMEIRKKNLRTAVLYKYAIIPVRASASASTSARIASADNQQ